MATHNLQQGYGPPGARPSHLPNGLHHSAQPRPYAPGGFSIAPSPAYSSSHLQPTAPSGGRGGPAGLNPYAQPYAPSIASQGSYMGQGRGAPLPASHGSLSGPYAPQPSPIAVGGPGAFASTYAQQFPGRPGQYGVPQRDPRSLPYQQQGVQYQQRPPPQQYGVPQPYSAVAQYGVPQQHYGVSGDRGYGAAPAPLARPFAPSPSMNGVQYATPGKGHTRCTVEHTFLQWSLLVCFVTSKHSELLTGTCLGPLPVGT